MPTIWIWILAVSASTVAILVGIKFYWNMLLAFMPLKERASEVHTVMTRDVWELKLYRYRRGRTNGEPVLLVHGALVNHHNFTQPEGACIIDELVARGLDCWALDIRLCRSSKPAFERTRDTATIDDVLLYDLPAVIRHIRKSTSYGRVHWVGHSQGGMLLYTYLQYWGNAFIASGATLGSPIGFDGAKIKFKSMPAIVKKYPAEFANILRALVPIFFYTGIRSSLFPINMRNLHPKMRPSGLFHAIEDPCAAATEQLLGWARTKTWKMLGGKLDVKTGLNTMDAPLFTIFAARDPFVSTDSAKAFFKALHNPDKKFALLSKENGCKNDYSHCDLAFGVDAPRMVFGPIADWIQAHPIAERVRAEEISEDDEPIRLALDPETRAGMLSGDSYAHVQAKLPASVSLEIERIPETKPAPATPPRVKKAPAKKALAKKTPANKVPAKAAPKKAVPKATPPKAAPQKVATKTMTAKTSPAPAPPKKATPPTKAAAPPKKKASAKPTTKLTSKPAPKTLPQAETTTPRITLAPSKAQKNKPSRLTQSAILSASEFLKDLEKKK